MPASPTPPAVHPITPDDTVHAAEALAHAFADDPVWGYLVGARFPEFRRRSPGLFRVFARHYAQLGGGWTTDGAQAAALWAPPGHWKAPLLEIASLLRPGVHLFGRNTVKALSALTALEKGHPREPHWYLAFVGARPEHQGKGFGGAVLRPVLDRCDRQGLPAYLESSKESNVPFYERLGFSVTGTHAFPGGPTMWLMWREPVPPEHP